MDARAAGWVHYSFVTFTIVRHTVEYRQVIKVEEYVLFVDDDPEILRFYEESVADEGYRTATAGTAEEAARLVKEHPPQAIVLDLEMPGMGGVEFCRLLKAGEDTLTIPITVVTGHGERDARLAALGAGADEFITKPITAGELRLRVRNMLKLKAYTDHLAKEQEILDGMVRERTKELQETVRQLEQTRLETIFRLSRAAEYKDEDTGAHIRRISFYCEILGRHLGFEEAELRVLTHSAPLHDLGKIGIPDAILLKPGKLTEDEFEIMKTHTTLGAEILAGSDDPYLKAGSVISLNHHERWDGKGYPNGISGEDIPLHGRIVAVADVFDALVSKRPYKDALPFARAVAIVHDGSGSQFDAHVVKAFSEELAEFERIHQTVQDED